MHNASNRDSYRSATVNPVAKEPKALTKRTGTHMGVKLCFSRPDYSRKMGADAKPNELAILCKRLNLPGDQKPASASC